VDFTKPITFNSLGINTLVGAPTGKAQSGYLLEQFDQSNLEIAAYAEKRALTDGIDASDVYLGRRRINAIVTVFGSTQGDFWDKQQDLLAAFSPTVAYTADTANLGFLPFDFYQPTADIATWPTSAYPDGIPLRYYLRPSQPPAYNARRDELGGTPALGLSNKYALALVARDPRKVAITATSSTASSVTNLGDYPAVPTIVWVSTTVTGDLTITIGAAVLSVNIDATSTTYTFDCNLKAFYKGATIRMDLMYHNSKFPTLAPGTNGITVSGGAVGQRPTVVFRHSFA